MNKEENVNMRIRNVSFLKKSFCWRSTENIISAYARSEKGYGF